MRSGTPLVGRSAELAWFDSAVERLGDGAGLAVLDFTGEAGIGKSRLVTEASRSARRRGLTVLRGRATEYERHVPYQPFTDAFADLRPADLDGLPEADALAPVLYGRAQAGLDRFGVHRATAALLAHLGERGPVLLVLDDMHWADPASIDLLEYLMRHPVPAPVLLVVARRSRQSPVPLAAGLARGAESGTVLPHALGPLPAAACAEQLGADLTPGQFEALYAASEGNPLYLLALLQAHRSGVARPASSLLLEALLLDELAPLGDRPRRTLEAVAVLGAHATAAMIASVTDCSQTEVLDDLQLLLARDLVRTDSTGRLALRHPVLRSLVHDRIEPWQQAAMHRTAAARLAEVGAPVPEQAHHAEHALMAWDPEAAEVLVQAAALSTGTAPESSAHWLEVALRYLPRTAEYATWRRNLIFQRAYALAVCGRLHESRTLLHEVIALSADSADSATRTLAVALCSGVERHLGHYPEATALLHRELTRRPDAGAAEIIALTLALGSLAVQDGSYPLVRDQVRVALGLAGATGDEAAEAALLAVAALGEALGGETALALAYVHHTVAILDALPDDHPADLCEPLARLAWAETQLDRFTDADRHAERGLALARRTGRTAVLPYLLLSKAHVASHTGRLTHALAQVDEAEDIARGFGSDELLVLVLCVRAQVLAALCPPGDPRPLAAASEAVARAGVRGNWLATNAWGMMGRAALLAGDPARAREAVLRAGGADLNRLQVSKRPMFREILVDACLALGERGEARVWAEQARAEAAALDLPGQRASALRSAAAVSAEGSRGRAVLYLEAAAESERAGAGYWEAYSLLLAARAMAGSAPTAEAVWRRGAELAEAGGAESLAGLAEAVRAELAGEPEPHDPRLEGLTAREREVAGLAGEGLTSGQIADKLFLSRRTVESHLGRVYRKTGVTTRTALAVLLAGHG